MDKFLLKAVTPATAKKSNKRSIESITEDEQDYSGSNRPNESILADEPDDDDDELDMNQEDMIAFTQAYCTQDIKDDDSDEEEEKEKDDGTNTGFNFTQGEEIEVVQPPPQELERRDSFHRDTAHQVSIDCGGTQRIFKLGETFVSDKEAGRLCKENIVVQGTTEAVYTIQQFCKSGSLRKKAMCRVRIPIYRTITDDSERKRIQQLYPNEYVTLHYPEKIELRHLVDRIDQPAEHPALVALASKRLVWQVTGLQAPMTRLDVRFEHPAYQKKLFKFDMLADYETPTCLDMFAGAGGMSTGFIRAGFDVRWLVEKDPQAAATLKLNHREGRVFEEQVEFFLAKAKAGKKLYPKPGQVHHVHASSPCQGYSLANRNGGVSDKANNQLAFMWIEYIRFFQPETASFENVTGMLVRTDVENDGSKISYWHRLLYKLLLDVNYQCHARVVTSSDYGDPQNRARVIIIAAKRGRRLPKWPEPTHGEDGGLPYVTVKDVLQDLESVEPEEEGGNGMVELQDGTVTFDHCASVLKSERKKLVANEPSKTVRRTNGIEHYSLERNITVREMARLQSFADDYEFCGSVTQKKSQIGNAVPTGLSTAIANCIFQEFH